jgi:hypothetical protein
MILYNVTISIDPVIEHDWLRWMREVHIPMVMEVGGFIESRLCRVHGEEEGGLTYAIGYLAPSKEHLDKYQENFAPKMQQEHMNKFSGRFAAFRTLLTVVEEFKATN